MKKSLISAALMLAFASAAQAQVPAPTGTSLSLYGLIDASYGKGLFADVFLREKADFHSGGDNGSSEGNSTTRIGIKGAVDVGSGVKANFKFETGGITSDGRVGSSGEINPLTGAVENDTPFFNRQAWFGLSGGFGEVRLGRQDSVPFQVMLDFDFNGASNGVSAGTYSAVGVFGGALGPGRQSRSLQYITPSMGGVTAQFGLVPKGNRGPGAKDVFSGGLKFAAGDLAAGLSFQTKDNSAAKDFVSVAGSYDFKVAKVMVGYTDGGKISRGGIGSGISVGAVAPVAGFNIGFHYAKNDDDLAKIESTEFFVNKEVYKNTYFYVEAGNWKTSLALNPLDSTAKTKGSGYAVGVIFVF